jgi:hypothetical protein
MQQEWKGNHRNQILQQQGNPPIMSNTTERSSTAPGQRYPSMVELLPLPLKQSLKRSWAEEFHKRIFSQMDRKVISQIFVKENEEGIPASIYMGLEIMKLLFDWSDEELIANLNFDLRVCYALGFENLGEIIVETQALTDQRDKLLKYARKASIEERAEIVKRLQPKDDERTDSLLSSADLSNFFANFTKVKQLKTNIDALRDFYAELPESEQKWYKQMVRYYVKDDSEKIIARIKISEINKHLHRLMAILLYFNEIFGSNPDLNHSKSFLRIRQALYHRYHFKSTKKNGFSPRE